MKTLIHFLWAFVKVSGIWLIPVILIVTNVILYANDWYFPKAFIPYYYMVIGIIVFIVFMKNLMKISSGVPFLDIGILDFTVDISPTAKLERERKKAMRPPIHRDLLYDSPEGFCFGKDFHTGKYVCKGLLDEGSVFISGGSGSGKTTRVIMNFLLWCRSFFLKGIQAPVHSFIADVKGQELWHATHIPNDGSIKIDPQDPSSYGIDPFYKLRGYPTDQEIYESCVLICESLIPPLKGDKSIWSDSSSAMLCGTMLYFWKYEGLRNLADILTAVLTRPIEETIQNMFCAVEPGSPEYVNVVDFKTKADEESSFVKSTFATLKSKINNLVGDQNLRRMIGGGSSKQYCPPMLLERDVYFCPDQSKIRSYSQVMALAINLTLTWIMELPEHSREPQRPYIGVIIDEYSEILEGLGGEISQLPQALRVVRSKGAFCAIACQTIAALVGITKNKSAIEDNLANMLFTVILKASTETDMNMVTNLAGKYYATVESVSGSGRSRKVTKSLRQENILRPSDLPSLPKKKEIILISPDGYCMVKALPYYEHPEFKNTYEVIQKLQEEYYNDIY